MPHALWLCLAAHTCLAQPGVYPRSCSRCSQDTLAKNLNVKQAEISKIENRADMSGEQQIQVFAAGQGEKVDDRGLLSRQPGRND